MAYTADQIAQMNSLFTNNMGQSANNSLTQQAQTANTQQVPTQTTPNVGPPSSPTQTTTSQGTTGSTSVPPAQPVTGTTSTATPAASGTQPIATYNPALPYSSTNLPDGVTLSSPASALTNNPLAAGMTVQQFLSYRETGDTATGGASLAQQMPQQTVPAYPTQPQAPPPSQTAVPQYPTNVGSTLGRPDGVWQTPNGTWAVTNDGVTYYVGNMQDVSTREGISGTDMMQYIIPMEGRLPGMPADMSMQQLIHEQLLQQSNPSPLPPPVTPPPANPPGGGDDWGGGVPPVITPPPIGGSDSGIVYPIGGSDSGIVYGGGGTSTSNLPAGINLPVPIPEQGSLDEILNQIWGAEGDAYVPDETQIEQGERVVSQDPIINRLLQEYQDQYVRGQATNEARYSDIMDTINNTSAALMGPNGVYGQALNRWMGAENDYTTMQNAAMNTRYATTQDATQRLNDVSQLYADRAQGIMGMYDTFGTQSEADIMARYQQDQARAAQDMARRGLGNTTVQESLSRGNQLQREADTRRLREDILGRKIGTAQQVTADWLGSMTNNFKDLYGIYDQYARAQTQYAQDLANLRQTTVGQQQQYGERYASLADAALQAMQGRTDEYPSLGEIANLILQAQNEGDAAIIPITNREKRENASLLGNIGIGVPNYTPVTMGGNLTIGG